jgi:hypothetical protein
MMLRLRLRSLPTFARCTAASPPALLRIAHQSGGRGEGGDGHVRATEAVTLDVIVTLDLHPPFPLLYGVTRDVVAALWDRLEDLAIAHVSDILQGEPG